MLALSSKQFGDYYTTSRIVAMNINTFFCVPDGRGMTSHVIRKFVVLPEWFI